MYLFITLYTLNLHAVYVNISLNLGEILKIAKKNMYICTTCQEHLRFGCILLNETDMVPSLKVLRETDINEISTAYT